MKTFDVLVLIYFTIAALLVIPVYIGIRVCGRLFPKNFSSAESLVEIIPAIAISLLWGLSPIVALFYGLNYGFEKLLDKFVPKK